MTPTDQEYLTGNPEKIPGDCVRACVASILDLDRATVPHFVHEHNSYWASYLDDWCESRGIEFVRLEGAYAFDMPVIWVGESPRNSSDRHAVVAAGGNIVFDPHPSRDGLNGIADHTYMFLPIKNLIGSSI